MGTGSFKRDELAFVFSLDKKKKYTIRTDKVWNEIQGYNDFFAFRAGHDLYIFNLCITSNNNYYNTPSSYNTQEKSELTSGQPYFMFNESEIYHVEFL